MPANSPSILPPDYPSPFYKTAPDGRGHFRGAVFFDRDGTLIHDSGYLSDPAKVDLLPGVRETLDALRTEGFLLFLFTNQSGVARGFFPLDTVAAVNRRMSNLLGAEEEYFDGVCIAPEHPDGEMIYRKPSPRFVLETVARYSLDPSECFMVGDRKRDLEAGIAANIVPVRYSGDIVDEKTSVFVREKSIASVSDFKDILGICLAGGNGK